MISFIIRNLKMKIEHKMNNMAMTNVTYERQNDVIAIKKTYSNKLPELR